MTDENILKDQRKTRRAGIGKKVEDLLLSNISYGEIRKILNVSNGVIWRARKQLGLVSESNIKKKQTALEYSVHINGQDSKYKISLLRKNF